MRMATVDATVVQRPTLPSLDVLGVFPRSSAVLSTTVTELPRYGGDKDNLCNPPLDAEPARL